jgi:hypothetical protein
MGQFVSQLTTVLQVFFFLILQRLLLSCTKAGSLVRQSGILLCAEAANWTYMKLFIPWYYISLFGGVAGVTGLVLPTAAQTLPGNPHVTSPTGLGAYCDALKYWFLDTGSCSWPLGKAPFIRWHPFEGGPSNGHKHWHVITAWYTASG